MGTTPDPVTLEANCSPGWDEYRDPPHFMSAVRAFLNTFLDFQLPVRYGKKCA